MRQSPLHQSWEKHPYNSQFSEDKRFVPNVYCYEVESCVSNGRPMDRPNEKLNDKLNERRFI